MTANAFLQQRETFGLEKSNPWALPALRLVFSVPRAYQDLADAWNLVHPGTRRALNKLVSLGFVAYQPGVIIDTATGAPATKESRRVARWRTTASGSRALSSFIEDLRNFEEAFPRTQAKSVVAVVGLLSALNLEDSHARFGMSANHAISISGIEPRLGRWWLMRFKERGWITELNVHYADVREVIPPHCRVTRLLCRQIGKVLDTFPKAPQALRVELRLNRSRFLDDIDPSRVGISGATDFDHDIEAQRIVSAMISSDSCVPDGQFLLEPRLSLPIDQTKRPWVFDPAGPDTIMYQPDALLSARDVEAEKTTNRRVVLEYERFQSRRDAWSHIERFLGWVHTRTLPFEHANLCFVVDSDSRRRTYIELIEAFCDHALDHPELMPPNPVILAVTSTPALMKASDALSMREWSRIALPRNPGSDTDVRPVLHSPQASPYEEYFGR